MAFSMASLKRLKSGAFLRRAGASGLLFRWPVGRPPAALSKAQASPLPSREIVRRSPGQRGRGGEPKLPFSGITDITLANLPAPPM
jgi:hypothetical protein